MADHDELMLYRFAASVYDDRTLDNQSHGRTRSLRAAPPPVFYLQ